MSDVEPPLAIPYATALDFDPTRYLRSGRRFGLAALLLAGVYVAVWIAGPGPSLDWFRLWDLRHMVGRFVIPVQAIFVGAGTAFMIVAGRRGDFGPWRGRYYRTRILNALAFAVLAAELSGVVEDRFGDRYEPWRHLLSSI